MRLSSLSLLTKVQLSLKSRCNTECQSAHISLSIGSFSDLIPHLHIDKSALKRYIYIVQTLSVSLVPYFLYIPTLQTKICNLSRIPTHSLSGTGVHEKKCIKWDASHKSQNYLLSRLQQSSPFFHKCSHKNFFFRIWMDHEEEVGERELLHSRHIYIKLKYTHFPFELVE
jgi:hypothetical protein